MPPIPDEDLACGCLVACLVACLVVGLVGAPDFVDDVPVFGAASDIFAVTDTAALVPEASLASAATASFATFACSRCI
jgi:hypothetical protein